MISGKRLRATRTGQHLSRRQLAEKAGSSQSTIKRIELGHPTVNPTARTIQDLADALGVPVTALLEETGAAA
jgi:transcriptional regulator with XRE-family HTH domain